MKLFIVESPAKCKTIKSYLGSDYTVEASYGHIRAIPPQGINVDSTTFEPKFTNLYKKRDVIQRLKSLASKASQVILATDPDREGEAISWHIYELLPAKDKKKCIRVTFNEIKKKAILEALNNPRDIDDNLVKAQKARQVLDRLIGYKASPLVWYAVSSGTSAGRVQSIALRLICERQKEIDAFISRDYWFIDALLGCQKGDFTARVITDEKDNRYWDEGQAKADHQALQVASYTVGGIERKVKATRPYPPFDTTSLQKACSVLFGWSATNTMRVAQTLYEAGVTTYLRTDSYNISKEALDEVRDHIKGIGNDYLPKSPNMYKKKSSAASQEAHECIRPTHVADTCPQLTGNDKRLYDLIRARFIACQMSPMLVDTVTYHIGTDVGNSLIARGQVVKFDGWFKAYPYTSVKDSLLPEVTEGEKLSLRNLDKSQHSTQPPPRYNDGSLVEKMEEEGVGRPSTRASILKSIRDKGYIEKDGKAFIPTELGMRISDYLTPAFKDFFMDLKFTAGLEEDLDLIADSKKSYLSVVKTVNDLLVEKVAKAKKSAPKKKGIETGHKCPECGKGNVVEKFSRYGRFFCCDSYPTCKVILVKNEDGEFVPKEKNKAKKEYGPDPCPKCGGKMVLRSSRYGKFYGCAAYPKCRAMRQEDGTEIKPKSGKKRKYKKKS